MFGHVILEANCFIGSRTSILSGQNQHQFSPEGKWLPANLDDFVQITVGENAWIGESALLMADIGRGAAVSAGSVVSQTLPEFVVVAGNPARFVRKMEVAQNSQDTKNSQNTETSVADAKDEGVTK